MEPNKINPVNSMQEHLFIKIFCFAFLLSTNATAQYTINGDASQTSTNCFRLTPNATSQVGSIWNGNVINLNYPFDFTFYINLGCVNANSGDGICFGLQNISSSIGVSGNGMGMGGVSPSLGVYIDTYQNISPDSDPSYDHISLNSNGNVDHAASTNLVGPVQALSSSTDIEDCDDHLFRVQWDPVPKTYKIWVDGSLRLSYTGNIVTNIFSGNPNVYWGFTGATGLYHNTQSFCILLAANFSSAGATACGTGTISFTDLSQSGNPITNWAWDFDDGTPVYSGSTAAHKNPTHTYAASGTYTVKQTVTSSAGTSIITHDVTVVIRQSPGGVCSGLDVWLKANAGTTGTTPLTAWTNQAAGGPDIDVKGSPNYIAAASTYNYNPYIDLTQSNRQYFLIDGYGSNDLSGIDYSSFFFTFELNNLTRESTQIATLTGITNGTPSHGTIHGADISGQAGIMQSSYDPSDFGSSAPASTWKRNGANVSYNALHTNSKHLLSAVSSGSATINCFLGGQVSKSGFDGSTRDWLGYVGELIAYSTTLSSTERNKVETYLAVKYGITLSNNYISVSGTNVYTVSSPYNRNIIGIAREDSEGLTQKQSHSDDDSVRIYLSALVTTNSGNTGSFSADASFVILGSNTGKLSSTAGSKVEIPAGCSLFSRIEREWKITKTNFSQSFNMNIKLSSQAKPGNITAAHLRLLIDDDGNFQNGGTSCYYTGDGSGVSISYSNPVITITGIGNTQIPDNATRYMTIGSVNSITPLPIELLFFNAVCNSKNTVTINWQTASETNNDYFTIERSVDGMNWVTVTKVKGTGNSLTAQNYSLIDINNPGAGSYYRIKQTDFDGQFHSFSKDMVYVKKCEDEDINLFPDFVQNSLFIYGSVIKKVEFYNYVGQKLFSTNLEGSETPQRISMDGFPFGVYILKLYDDHSNGFIKKISWYK